MLEQQTMLVSSEVSTEISPPKQVVDVFRKDIRLENIGDLSEKLAIQILSEYQPDIIISVESGGFLPAKQIAEYIGAELHSIVIRREDKFSDAYNSSISAGRKLYLKVAQGVYFLLSQPRLFGVLPERSTIEGKRICIVDDLIHTGKTIEMMRGYLEMLGAKEIKTACLGAVGRKTPDFFLFSGHARFPWSKNSPDYERYRKSIINNELL